VSTDTGPEQREGARIDRSVYDGRYLGIGIDGVLEWGRGGPGRSGIELMKRVDFGLMEGGGTKVSTGRQQS